MSRRRETTWGEMRRDMAGSTARAFGTLYRRYQAEANAAYAARGWKDVTLAHVQFLMEIEESGTRLSDVASALRTTRQYAGKVAQELEAKRLVVLAADPTDGRAVLAKPTERGHALFQDACHVRTDLEKRFLSGLSPSKAKVFASALAELVAGLDSTASK